MVSSLIRSLLLVLIIFNNQPYIFVEPCRPGWFLKRNRKIFLTDEKMRSPGIRTAFSSSFFEQRLTGLSGNLPDPYKTPRIFTKDRTWKSSLRFFGKKGGEINTFCARQFRQQHHSR